MRRSGIHAFCKNKVSDFGLLWDGSLEMGESVSHGWSVM
jgi:hypothetical protein